MPPFRTARQFPAPPEAVFAAIRDPQRLARWWGPVGFSNTFHQFDFRPGGRWEFTMHGPDGTDYPNASEFTEIVADARVCIRHVVPPLFTLTIVLAPSAQGCLLSWEQAFDDPAVARAVQHIVEPANEQNLDRLGQELGRTLAM